MKMMRSDVKNSFIQPGPGRGREHGADFRPRALPIEGSTKFRPLSRPKPPELLCKAPSETIAKRPSTAFVIAAVEGLSAILFKVHCLESSEGDYLPASPETERPKPKPKPLPKPKPKPIGGEGASAGDALDDGDGHGPHRARLRDLHGGDHLQEHGHLRPMTPTGL